MPWTQKVERWRELVDIELNQSHIPLPVNLILAVIHVESRGYPGTTNKKSGASGLMQVMPSTLNWYNKQTDEKITLQEMRSEHSPVRQIRVGIWVLGQFWRGAYRYLRQRLVDEIPTDELAKIADLFYVAGPGATKQRLDKLSIPLFSYVEERFPNWNALPHPRNVWDVLPGDTQWDLEKLSKWLEGSLTRSRRAREVAILAIIAITVGYWWFLKSKKSKK